MSEKGENGQTKRVFNIKKRDFKSWCGRRTGYSKFFFIFKENAKPVRGYSVLETFMKRISRRKLFCQKKKNSFPSVYPTPYKKS